MEADTAIAKYARATFNAVSAGFISRDDLFSPEPSAKIRVRLGHILYRNKTDKELLSLSMLYQSLFLLIEGIKGNEDGQRHCETVFDYYSKLWGRITDNPEGKQKTESSLAATYRHLFKNKNYKPKNAKIS